MCDGGGELHQAFDSCATRTPTPEQLHDDKWRSRMHSDEF